MSVQAMAWVLEHSEATLGARLVLLSIASHADRIGENAWGSVATYADEARLSERQTRYALRELEAAGEIESTGRHGARADRATNVYRLPLMNGGQNPHLVTEDGGQSSTLRGAILDTPPVPDGGQPIAPEPKTEPSLNRPTAPRPRDELFETLCELASWDFHALTKAARGTVNDVAKQLRAVGATPEEARRRADTYRRNHPTWDFTIEALAKHWPGLAAVRPLSKGDLEDEFRQIAEAAERRLAQ